MKALAFGCLLCVPITLLVRVAAAYVRITEGSPVLAHHCACTVGGLLLPLYTG